MISFEDPASTGIAHAERDAVSARPASDAEASNWDGLLERFSDHRVVHRTCWIRFLAASTGARPLFIVFEKQGELVGCLPGLVVRVGPCRLFGSPLPGWQTASMGPVFDRQRASSEEIVTAAVHLLEARFNVHHIEMITAAVDHDAMRSIGFRAEPIPTMRAPLYPGDVNRTFAQLKDTARRNIRRATRLGLEPRIETSEEFVDEAYDQMQEVFTRGGNAIPFRRQHVLEYFRHMRSANTLLALSVCLPGEATRIATGLFTIAGRELFLWQWAHRTRFRWYRPTELMTWTAMTHAMERGCTTFDLMGLGEFKEKFGATCDASQYRWVRSRYRWLTSLRDAAERGYRWQQSMRGRLSRGAAAWLNSEDAAASDAGSDKIAE